jgi:hypothetical protein
MRQVSIAGIMPVRKRCPARESGMGKEETLCPKETMLPCCVP